MTGGLRLAVGSLTAIPVGAARVTPATSTAAMLLGPVAALPLGALVALVCWAGAVLGLPPVAVAFTAVGLLAAGSRALHLDGLADVADGLTAGYERERSLSVMKSGAAGPAGVVALVVVLGTQAAALAAYVPHDALLAGALVSGSRAALWITCARGVPAARPDGLGAAFASRVPVAAAALGWVALAALAALVDPWRGPLTIAAAALVVVALVRRTTRRLGGVTGDVFGAAIELALAVLLLGLAGAR